MSSESRERDPLTYAIIGAAMEVHRQLGCGFLEAPYREALELEFGERSINYACEVKFQIGYRGRLLRSHYRADFVCFEQIIVEVKAIQAITRIEEAQIMNYLRASGLQKALLLNFGRRSLEYKRFLYGPQEQQAT